MGIWRKNSRGARPSAPSRAERRSIFESEPLTVSDALEQGLYDVTAEARATGLPIFDPVSTRVMQHPHEMEAEAAQTPGFVREVYFRLPSSSAPHTPLREALKLLDRELDDVAAHCGALVVGHEWGLVDARSQRPPRHPQSLVVPNGYTLVARVESLSETQPLTPELTSHIEVGLKGYAADKSAGEPLLTDLAPKQFGLLKGFGTEEGLRLLDLDGRFS